MLTADASTDVSFSKGEEERAYKRIEEINSRVQRLAFVVVVLPFVHAFMLLVLVVYTSVYATAS